jgi:hypothetical protein
MDQMSASGSEADETPEEVSPFCARSRYGPKLNSFSAKKTNDERE